MRGTLVSALPLLKLQQLKRIVRADANSSCHEDFVKSAQIEISPQSTGEAVVKILLLAGQVHIYYYQQHLPEMPALWPRYNSAPCPCWERGTLGPTPTMNHRAIHTLSSPLAQIFYIHG